MWRLDDGLLQIGARSAILVSGGAAPSPALLDEAFARLGEVSLYCADGGVGAVLAAGRMPDAVLGDLDSIAATDRTVIEEAGVRLLTYPAQKDDSDTHLALRMLFETGVEEILLLGATGGRLDHELANLMLLMAFGRSGKSVVVWDAQNRMRYAGCGTYQVAAAKGYFSLIPVTADGMTVSLSGVAYPLQEAAVGFDRTLLLSNAFAAAAAEVVVHAGDGYMIISRDAT